MEEVKRGFGIMADSYSDIINLPHHTSATHPHMPDIDRAAQFSPFAALTGYDDAVQETARLNEVRMEKNEYGKENVAVPFWEEDV